VHGALVIVGLSAPEFIGGLFCLAYTPPDHEGRYEKYNIHLRGCNGIDHIEW